MAQTRILKPADNAYQYPLLIKRLLMSGPRYNPDQEIVYANRSKYTYKDLVDRIHRLANALTDTAVNLSVDDHRQSWTGIPRATWNASLPSR